jgi:hypothetical protein
MINNDLKLIDAMSIDNVRKLKGKQNKPPDYSLIFILFSFQLKIKHLRMHIMLNMKIVEKNFKNMFDILNVF